MSDIIHICCVKWGKKYTSDYVNILFDMVLRNVSTKQKLKFYCFTDDKTGLNEAIICKPLNCDLQGWWNKLYLFSDDLFPNGEQVFYFDLDTVIVSGLDDIFKYRGDFAILRDFYRQNGLQSSIMSWKANKFNYIWDDYVAANYPIVEHGDQGWIEKTVNKFDLWQNLFPGCFVSYKVHAKNDIPKGAKVIVFHGEPRPHEVFNGWVPKIWKVGGGSSLEFEQECNTKMDKIVENIKYSLSKSLPILDKLHDAHEAHAVIVGGGPSIKEFESEIRARRMQQQSVFALNNSWRWLDKAGIGCDFQVMVDARPENAQFVSPYMKLYATQCHKDVIDQCNEQTLLWNNYISPLDDLFKDRDMFWVGSGTTVGIRALYLLYILGYRTIHVYGYDSSYSGSDGHAYPQNLNDGEKVIEVEAADRKFTAAPWMVSQAEDFLNAMEYLTSVGVCITIHGDGLLPHMCKHFLTTSYFPNTLDLEDGDTAPMQRAKSIFKHIAHIKNPKGAEIGVFAADLSRILLSRNDLSLIMVDSWECHDEDGEYAKSDDFHAKLSQEKQNAYYELSKNRVSTFGDRATIYRKRSVDAAQMVQDGSLDFVFIDADHTYEGVKSDLNSWFKKLKKGGILSGHDFKNTDYPCWGVEKAVNEFCQEHNLVLELGHNFTWFAKEKD